MDVETALRELLAENHRLEAQLASTRGLLALASAKAQDRGTVEMIEPGGRIRIWKRVCTVKRGPLGIGWRVYTWAQSPVTGATVEVSDPSWHLTIKGANKSQKEGS